MIWWDLQAAFGVSRKSAGMEDFGKKIMSGVLSKRQIVFERVLALFRLRVFARGKEDLVLHCGAFFFRVFFSLRFDDQMSEIWDRCSSLPQVVDITLLGNFTLLCETHFVENSLPLQHKCKKLERAVFNTPPRIF